MYCQKQHDPGNLGLITKFLEHNNLSLRNYGAKFYCYQVDTDKVWLETVPECQKPPSATLKYGSQWETAKIWK